MGEDVLANGIAHVTLDDAPPVAENVRVRFAVTAPTQYGESLFLSGDTPAMGSFSLESAIPMSYEHPGVWVAEVTHSRSKYPIVQYKYAVRRSPHDGGEPMTTYEPGGARVLHTALSALDGNYMVRDTLRSAPDLPREVFGTAAFKDVIFNRPTKIRKGASVTAADDAAAVSKAVILGKGAFVARISVFAERVAAEDELCVVGMDDSAYDAGTSSGLGRTPVAMSDHNAPDWTVSIAIPPNVQRLAFKFLIRNKSDSNVRLEEERERVIEFNHEDRVYVEKNVGSAAVVFLTSERSMEYPEKWRGAGIAIPVFSLRSKQSCGVGEFRDLHAMVDLCAAARYQMLQLLPINDTTSFNSWRDSYPYSAVSCFALHPQYISIEQLGALPTPLMKEYNAARDRLNALAQIDYEEVMKVKMYFIRKMYALHKVELLKSKEFEEYFEENKSWLVPYAVFRFLMEVNGSSNFDTWGARKSVSMSELEELASPDSFHFDYIGMAYYTQYHLHKQLTAAAEYAAKNKVVLKGDLPIGVNRHCVDTWVNPHLFRLHMQAGAPPDFFAKHGQNWFFPTYDWQAMSKDNYGWWRARLGTMARYFDAYRIDHILGFFRIWEIPERFRTGMSGRMFPSYAISRTELEGRGLWDIDRFVLPYIRDGLLQDLVQEDWWKVKEKFFEPMWHDRLKFKDEFDTERKCEAALELPSDAPEDEKRFNEKVKYALFTLFNNVCLLRDEHDPDSFHPRFMMHDTSSYHELPAAEWKSALYDLYEDYFFRRQEELWRKSGLEKLPMMKTASDMLVCGEDLGFTPTSVPDVMKETSILSLKVQRMPGGDAAYGDPANYPYASVATTSSHDTSTFRGWWEEIPGDIRQRYWSELMHRGGEPPAECTPDIAEWALRDHLACPSMWAVFPLQDLLAIDSNLRREVAAEEQINNPANSMHYWRFRLHIGVEEILKDSAFVERLRKLNEGTLRGKTY